MKLIYIGQNKNLTFGKTYNIYDKNGIEYIINDIGNKFFFSNREDFVDIDDWRIIQINKYLHELCNLSE